MTFINVTSGGAISGTTLSGGDFAFIYSGGLAISTVVNDHAGMTVYSGGVASFTVLSGGFEYVSSGGVISGTRLIGGNEAVYDGGSASFSVVSANGSEAVYSGGKAFGDVLSGGQQAVYAGGSASDTVVSSGATEYLYSGGSAGGTVVREGGDQFVFSGGTASDTVVSSGGTITIIDGGAVDFLVVSRGGSIQLPELNFDSGGSAVVDGTDLLTITDGARSVTLQLAGSYIGEFFIPTVDPNGDTGTLLTLIEPPRTLFWTGAQDGDFASAGAWNDLTNKANPAAAPPNTTDTTEFLIGGGSITGTGTVAALEFGGGVSWQMTSGASLSAVSGVTVGLGSLLLHGGAAINGLGLVDEISGASGLAAAVTVDGVGASWSSQAELVVGGAGAGDLLIRNEGTARAGIDPAGSQGVAIGRGIGGSGEIQVTGTFSLLANTGAFVVGDAGLGGLLIQAGGTVLTTQGMAVGLAGAVIANTESGSGSAVNVTGAGSNFHVAGALVVGNAGFGLLSISQAATVTAASLDAAAGAGGDGAITITDAGSNLNLSGLLTVGDQSSGSLNIVNGASVTVGGLAIGTGASGSGNVVIGPGSHLTLTGTSINVGLAGSGVLDIQGGTLALVAGTTLSPGTFGRIVQVGGLIDPATVFDASGGSFGGGGTAEASGTIVNSSLATVSGGAETLLAPLITSSDPVNVAGVWSIKSGGTLVLDVNTFDNSQTISFADLTGVLTIGQQVTLDATQTPRPIAASALSGFAAPIMGYKAGDKITFSGLSVASDQVSGNVVTLFDGGHNTLGSLTFQTSKGAADKAGATAAAAQIVPCFAAGTRIETMTGPVAVEKLCVGDVVRTLLGGAGDITWVGSRTVDCPRHPRPDLVWPVRIARDAFARNLPERDLLVSPDHAIYVDGVLIPAKHLINGTTIRQMKRRQVTYHHIELARHDVVLAEGLPAETYLDTGDRAKFSGGDVIVLHPNFVARSWEMRGCAELVVTGPRLHIVRERLRSRARLNHRERRPPRQGHYQPRLRTE